MTAPATTCEPRRPATPPDGDPAGDAARIPAGWRVIGVARSSPTTS